MNLDTNPTVEELRELVRQCDDSTGHHVLWVKKSGDVEITCIPTEQTPHGFEDDHPEMQVCFEPFLAGNEYVGPDAADDDEWISELFESLKSQWHQAKGKPDVSYADSF
jgi:hypothetical protein